MSFLATIIHLLNEMKVSENDCNKAQILIDMFRSLALQTLGPGVHSYSIHAIQHLPLMVKLFGALWSSSASMFESSYHHLNVH